MADDTALALAAVKTYVARLPDAVIEWHADAASGLKTVGSQVEDRPIEGSRDRP